MLSLWGLDQPYATVLDGPTRGDASMFREWQEAAVKLLESLRRLIAAPSQQESFARAIPSAGLLRDERYGTREAIELLESFARAIPSAGLLTVLLPPYSREQESSM